MVQAVRDVGEEGAARGKLFHQGDRLFQMRMGRVGLAAQRVQNEDVEVCEQGKALGMQIAQVGQIGGRAEAEAGNGLATVGDGYARNLTPNSSTSAPGVVGMRCSATRALVGYW